VLLRQVQRVRFRGIICERCGVEVTRRRCAESGWATSSSPPVVHIWYLRGTRSGSPTCSWDRGPEELKAKQLEKVIYFAAYLVTKVDEEKRHNDLPSLEAELLSEIVR